MAAEEPQQQPDGIHPDVRAALENEHVREALAVRLLRWKPPASSTLRGHAKPRPSPERPC
jgi:hypothetical protein